MTHFGPFDRVDGIGHHVQHGAMDPFRVESGSR